MKNSNRSLRLFAYSLCLVAGLYNCKSKDVDSLTPFTYTIKGLDDVKLPEVKATVPAPVLVTPASVAASAQASAVTDGLKNIAASGQVPAAVQQAAADVAKAIPAAKASSLAAGFTPDVLNNLGSTGKLPDNLKSDVASVTSNPAMQGYWPTFTLPKVNGKSVGGRVGAVAITPIVETNAVTESGVDACKKAANDAYATAIANLNTAKQAQTATITTAYAKAEAAANAGVPACQSGIPAKYLALVQAAKTNLDANVANLNAAKTVLGEATYNLLVVLNYVAYSQLVSGLVTLQAAETNACAATRDATIASAAIARDTDLNTINTNYNAVVAAATKTRDQIINSCHNQGNGG